MEEKFAKRTGKDGGLPNPMKGGKKMPVIEFSLPELKSDAVREFRKKVLKTASMAARICNELDVKCAARLLLTEKEQHVRIRIAKGLEAAAEQRKDIRRAIPALGQALFDDSAVVKLNAARALAILGHSGADLLPAYQSLLNAKLYPELLEGKRWEDYHHRDPIILAYVDMAIATIKSKD